MKFISATKSHIGKHYSLIKGWTTNRKIVVFESDDWGSVRMPDKQAFNILLNAGIRVTNSHYCCNDSLATSQDMEFLFETLSKHHDAKNNPPVITANTIVANPDFDRIKASNYQHYYYEPFTQTLKRYSNTDFNVWKQGIEAGVFFPQMHGREHLNVSRWLKYLQNNSREHHLAFSLRTYAISRKATAQKEKSVFQALNADSASDLLAHATILKEGYDLFEKIFGYKSCSFIAPNYIWHSQHEAILFQMGVKYLQGNFQQLVPRLDSSLKSTIRYCGESNRYNQKYLVRNGLFEPSSRMNYNWVQKCLNDISTAFFFKKPAIITTHRVNFIGRLNPLNRDNNLLMLNELISTIIKRWPSVEFMNSVQLGRIIDQTGNPL